MPDRRFDARRLGMRRVRAVTGWVIAAGVAATSAITLGVSGVASAAGATLSHVGGSGAAGDSQGTTQTGQGDGSQYYVDPGQSGQGFAPPAQAPGGGFQGSGGFSGGDASSGGS
jgi:hypothetical protein